MSKLFVPVAVLLAASTAFAQGAFYCQASAGTPGLIRAEGITERLNDIVLTCTGGTGGSGTADISIALTSVTPDAYAAFTAFGTYPNTYGATVTSRLVAPATNGSEAMLLIDDLSSPPVVGTNLIQGVQSNPYSNQIKFPNVPIQPPGSGTRTFRITNLRVDARDTSYAFILANIYVSGATSVPIMNPTLLVGIKASGTHFALQTAAAAPASNLTYGLASLNAALAASQTATGGVLTNLLLFNEGFAQSFRKRNTATTVSTPTLLADQGVPGTDYHTESGFYLSTLPGANGLNVAGLATQGTRLVARFTNVPAGVALYVTTVAVPSSPATSAKLVAADALGVGTYSAVTPTTTVLVGGTPVGIAPVTVTGGVGAATWELLDADPTLLESYTFGLVVAYAAPQIGYSTTVTGGLGPLSTVAYADNTSPVPRFADVSADTASCATTPCLTAAPTAISISYATAAADPAPIGIFVGSTGAALSYTASLAASVPGWISLGSTSGTTPSTVPVIFTPGNLPPGVYQASITLSSPTSAFAPVTVPVVLTVTVGLSGYIPFACTASVAVPPAMRAEGLSELIGDIVLTCSGGTPTGSGAPVPRYDVTLNLPTTANSRTYSGGWSEALLIVDEPGSGLTGASNNQLACNDASGTCTLSGTGTGVSYSGAAGHPNVFLGHSGGNAVVFPSVPIDPPGTCCVVNSSVPGGFARVLRIANVRADATAISLSGGTAQLLTTVTISGGAVTVLPPGQIAGFVQASQSFSTRLPDNSAATSGLIINPGNTSSPQRAGVLRFSELFGTAFRTRTAAAFVDSQTSPTPVAQNVPGLIYNSESGFYSPSLTSQVVDFSTAGLASAGTRVRAKIGNIPAGMRVFVSTVPVTFTAGVPSVATTGPIARLVTDEMLAFNPAASTATLGGIPATELTVTGGAATAVWEVLNENPAVTENLDFAFWVQLSTNTPTPTATITASYAPAPPAFDPSIIATSTLPVPRFVAGTAAQATFGVRLPTTVSLYGTPNPSTLGGVVILTAVVSGGASSGKATFYDGTTVLGTSALTGGQATLVTRLLPSGVRRLHAYYAGDGVFYASSTSATVTLTVNSIASDGFVAMAPAATDYYPSGVAVGDFNGDGKADVAVANSGTVSVLLGNGDGTFQTAVNLPVGSCPQSVAVGDFNGDGKTDLAVANACSGNVSILLGNGDGSFQTAVNYPAVSGSHPGFVVVADFNRDGIADLAVSGYGGGQINVFLGNGDGTFQAAITNRFNGGLQGPIAAGDFDRDGIPDLVAITSNFGIQLSILRGNGDGTFTDTTDFSAPNAASVTVGDLDGDGNLDLVTANITGPFPQTISVFMGIGDGTFQTGVSYAAGSSPNEVAIGDFNGDGKADLAVANYGLSILPGNGNGTFGTAVPYGTASSPAFVAVSDFNNDGIADLVVASVGISNVFVLRGYRSPRLSIAVGHTGNFSQGQTGATYMVTVTNAAYSDPTSGTVTVTETVPAGMTLVSMAGTGWTCPGTLSNNCTRTDALNGGTSYPPILVTVSVSSSATTPLVNTVGLSGGGSAPASATDSTIVGPFGTIRVNAGGAAYTDGSSNVWAADTGFLQGGSNSTTAAITGTSDQPLYRTEHYSATGALNFVASVPNSYYTVTLKFAEIYYTAAAQRVFNIAINGTTVLSNLDIFTAAGGANKAYDLSYPVTVTGGQIAVTLTAVTGFPKINAIQIVQSTPLASDFSIAATPASATVYGAATTSYTVTTTVANGFAGIASLGVTGLPTAASATFTPTSIAGAGSSTLAVTAGSTTPTGTYPLTITGISGSLTHTATVSFVVQPGPPIRINAGGPAYTDSSSLVWAADTGYQAGGSGSTTTAITGTLDSTLYQTEHYSPGSYQFPVPNGSYAVKLKFAEIYYTSAGQRVFDIAINGNTVQTHLDVFAAAGGANKAYDATYYATVTTGQLTIAFTAVTGLTKVNAIQITPVGATPDFAVAASPYSQTVTAGGSTSYTFTNTALNGYGGTATFSVAGLPTGASASFSPSTVTGAGSTTMTVTTGIATPTGTSSLVVTAVSGSLTHTAGASLAVLSSIFLPIRVNAGGPAYTDSLNQLWAADTGYQQGGPNSTTAAITGTSDPTLYQTEHYSTTGSLTYQFAVPNGSYAVKLKFAEIYYTSINQRVFNVAINGTMVQSHLDIFAAAGGGNKAYDLTFPFTVSTGQLAITLTAVTGYPKINAIDIELAGSTPDFTVAASPSSQSAVVGGSTSFIITTTSVNGYGGTVSFSASGLPTGATASFNPTTTVAGSGSSTMTVTTVSGTPLGTSSLVVTATSGTLAHTTGATLVVTAVMPPPAGAFACVASAATPNVRAEGRTEIIGDVVITCTGGVPLTVGSTIPTADITVSLGSSVTSRLLPVSGVSNSISEALLLIDEPGSGLASPVGTAPFGPNAGQTICPTPLAGCTEYVSTLTPANGPFTGLPFAVATNSQQGTGAAVAGYNVFQGVVNANQVTFHGVPVLPPVATGLTRVFRITNIRIDASALGNGVTQVLASLSATGTSFGIAGPVQVAGNVQSSLSGTAGAGANVNECSGQTKASVNTLSFAEGFGTAFKTRVAALTNTSYAGQAGNPVQNIPGWLYNSESGFVLAGMAGGQTAGLADFGTRLKAQFSNIPAGVRLFVSTSNVLNNFVPAPVPAAIGGSAANAGSTGYAQLVASESGALNPVSSTDVAPGVAGAVPVVELTVTGGAATAVWEVINTNPAALENFKFAVYATYTSSSTAGTAVVNLSYAPDPTVHSTTIPEFINSSTALYLFSASACTVSTFTPIRVNAGGPAYTDSLAQAWSADTGYQQGGASSTTAAITGTSDPTLYQTEHYSTTGSLVYQFSVPNGSYSAKLKFAEIYYTSAGQRVFNIAINGTTVLSNLDIFSAASGANKAYDLSYPVTVAGGLVTITLTAVTGYPKINAIEITQPSVAPDFTVTAAPSSQSVAAGGSASYTITTTAANSFSGVVGFSASGLPLGATASFSPTTVTGSGSTTMTVTTASGTPAGTSSLIVTATSGALSHIAGAALAVNSSAFTPIRVNAGGPAYTDYLSQLWAADTGYQQGGPNATTASIAGTSSPTLYQTEHYSATGALTYQFGVPNGSYTATLKFAEIYYTSAGQRVFDVALNGATVQSHLDIFAAAGANHAYDLSYPVTVTGGQLTITLTAVTGYPKINAIEITSASATPDFTVAASPYSQSLVVGGSTTYTITTTELNGFAGTVSFSASGLPVGATATFSPTTVAGSGSTTMTVTTLSGTTLGTSSLTVTASSGALSHIAGAALVVNSVTFSPIRVNAGGGAYTDSLSQQWLADTGYLQGAANSTVSAITGTSDPTLYQTEHFSTTGTLAYQFTVPNGSRTVTLKFAEIWYTSAAQRVFNIAINGTTVLSNLDLFSAAGGANKAYDLSYPVTVSGGQVTVTLTAVTGYPKINAIQIQ